MNDSGLDRLQTQFENVSSHKIVRNDQVERKFSVINEVACRNMAGIHWPL